MKTFNIDTAHLVRQLAKDVGIDGEDIELVLRRFTAEGMKFLTFTLPSVSKALVRSLELGYFERPTAFAWKGKSLWFLQSFFSKIFDKKGDLLQDPCPFAIRSIRQFCEYFYKLALATSPKDEEHAIKKFKQNEADVKALDFDDDWVDSLRKNLHTYYPSFCNTPIHEVFASHRPRFGPGSFAEKVNTNASLHKLLPSRISGLVSKSVGAYSGYFKAYPSSVEEIVFDNTSKLSRVAFVSKDSRGPRVISMEPLHLLKAQMSYLDWSIKTLQHITGGRIQFVDQAQSNNLARAASLDRSMATLDLKDASDRVSYRLVSRVFANTLAPAYFMKNTRSTHSVLPTGEVIPLCKLSGMGSGLTFPTMSLLIHLSICTAVQNRTGRSYRDVMKSVYVYGDDVIVPNSWYNFAITALKRSGLAVNTDKSFFKGFFRESCGGDYFKGVSNTPCRLKLDKCELGLPSDYKDGILINNDRMLIKLNRHANELSKSHMYYTARYLHRLQRKALGHRNYPRITGDSSVIGEWVEGSIPYLDSNAYCITPIVDKSSVTCPSKYLGGFLSPRVLNQSYDFFNDYVKQIRLAYGCYIRPRNVKLTLRKVLAAQCC